MVLLDHISRRYMGQGRAQRCLVLFAAFCPLTLFEYQHLEADRWGFCAATAVCFWLLEERLLPARCGAVRRGAGHQTAGTVGWAGAGRLLFGGYCGCRAGWQKPAEIGRPDFGGAALALLPPLLAGLPFYGAKNLVPSLMDKYITTASGDQYATINAFNWFAALGGNWQALDACPVFNLSWKVLGIFNIAVITVLLLWCWR